MPTQGLAEKAKYQPDLPGKISSDDKKISKVRKSKTAIDHSEPEKQIRTDELVQKKEIKTKDDVDLSQFKRFNPNDLPDSFTMMMSAPRGSGKSHGLKHILKVIQKRFKHMYLFSETAELQENVYDYCPIDNLYAGFDEFVLKGIMDKQKEIKKRNKNQKKKYKVENPILIVLDDVVNDKNMQRSPALKDLFTLGRHSQVSVVILLQNLSSRDGVSTIIRKNVDAFACFNTHDGATREMAAISFASIINKKEGELVMSAITEEFPYQMCVCLLRNKDKGKIQIKKYSDYIFKYLAPQEDAGNFMVGSRKDYKKNKKRLTTGINQKFQFQVGGYNQENVVGPTIRENYNEGFRIDGIFG